MFIANWRQVLKRAWSVRLLVLAGVLSGLEVALPLLGGIYPIPTGIFAALTFLSVGGAFVARILAQKGLSNADQQDCPDEAG
ncbi:hypothetical protein IB237_23225 [Agrobacterium sp. AGB01]|uniref:DUF7940 domain-containing protein n=1 Tax=Agrobacterium sp. AGB01 TaxID=2769302 RepID=UPI00177F70CE|nr:hypothetical protein [Agrobacterium sp. AGB01]MBD9390116.1 hypothetical protein [Agrobacterium sp. AGB01]